MKKYKLIAVLGMAGIILIGAVAFACLHKKQPERIVFETETITTGSIGKTVTATGTVEPISKVEVGTQVSGNISKLYVDYNSVVKKGQLIAELDRTNLRSELTMQENSLASAENEMNYQQKNYERTRNLYDQHMVSDAAYEEAEYRYKTAVYTYNRAKESVATAKTNLGYSYIYSPIDGVILSKSVEEGQTVAASFSTPTLFTIANDLTQMQVIADVDEADIGQVKEGQYVEFTVDAFPDETFKGEVVQIRLEAQVSSNVVTYEVVINAPNPDLKLMPGLTANISIYSLKKDDILLLPAKALRYTPSSPIGKDAGEARRPDTAAPHHTSPSLTEASGNGKENRDETAGHETGSNYTVYVLQNNRPAKREITTGATDGIHLEILSGLKSGDQVIVGETVSATQSAARNGKDNTENKQSPFMPGPPGSKNKK